MFKRFMIGFVLGIAAMQYYVTHYYTDMEKVEWNEDTSSKYRGDKTHEEADRLR